MSLIAIVGLLMSTASVVIIIPIGGTTPGLYQFKRVWRSRPVSLLTISVLSAG